MSPALLDRRTFLVGLGAGTGLALARGLGVAGLGAPDPGDFDATLRALGASLSPLQREQLVLPLDDPTRQVANTIATLERPHLGTLLSPVQRALVQRLYEGMLSPRGREAFAGTVAVEGRLDGCVLALYGEPERGAAHAQVVISGGHLLLRGGARIPGAAFGGGIAYGHQIGNGAWRVPGNSFAYHGDAANRLYAALAPAEAARALLPAPPHELVLQPQGSDGDFPGVPIGALGEPGQEAAAALLDAILSCHPEREREAARACLDANGGLAALHFAVYETHGFHENMRPWASLDAAERARRGPPYWQVWRLEGPGTVVHFQGHPHVHAYVAMVRDPARANLGESLGRVETRLEGESLRALLEAALRRATGEALAFHAEQVPGRFCPGEITTGLAYALDPYRNRVAVATIAGRAMAPPLRDRLAAAGVAVEPGAAYRIATTDYFASRIDLVGESDRVETDATRLRDALVAHLRAA